MTTAVERLGEDRRMIFSNVANGVPIQQIMSAFRRSEKEVMDEVKFVGWKIGEYRHRAKLPPLNCESLKDISWNRLALLETLQKLGPNFLGTALALPARMVEQIDHPSKMRDVQARTGMRVSQ
jgi:hypothetical protein